MIIPQALNKGDNVAVICPATGGSEKERENARRNLENIGLNPVFFPSCYEEHGYLAGSDERRLKDLTDAFSDPEMKAVICLRGGYGCPRFLADIDYDIIRKNPKHFLGFSDISVIHTAINQLCGQMTIHGSMPSVSWERSGDSIYMSTERCLFGFPEGPLENPPGKDFSCFIPGKAEGLVCGGNLSRIVATLGSPYEIDTRGKLLFIEEIGEMAEDIDLMMMSLALAGKLRDCAGVILGYIVDCENTTYRASLSTDTLFREILEPYGKPVIRGLCSGHDFPFVSFPLGAWAEMDAESGIISFSREKTESAE